MISKKVSIILLALAIYPASAYALPIIPLAIALLSSGAVAGIVQTYTIINYWPLAVGLISFYAFMHIAWKLMDPKWGYDYSGTAAFRAKMAFAMGCMIFAVGVISMTYYLGGFEYLAQAAQEAS